MSNTKKRYKSSTKYTRIIRCADFIFIFWSFLFPFIYLFIFTFYFWIYVCLFLTNVEFFGRTVYVWNTSDVRCAHGPYVTYAMPRPSSAVRPVRPWPDHFFGRKWFRPDHNFRLFGRKRVCLFNFFFLKCGGPIN